MSEAIMNVIADWNGEIMKQYEEIQNRFTQELHKYTLELVGSDKLADFTLKQYLIVSYKSTMLRCMQFLEIAEMLAANNMISEAQLISVAQERMGSFNNAQQKLNELENGSEHQQDFPLVKP